MSDVERDYLSMIKSLDGFENRVFENVSRIVHGSNVRRRDTANCGMD